MRNDSRVHQAQLKKNLQKERKREEKKKSSFPILRNCSLPPVCSLVRSLSSLVPDCPDVMYKRILSCAVSHTHGYDDDDDDDESGTVLASKSHQCREKEGKSKKSKEE